MIKVGSVEIQQNHFPDNTLLMKLNPGADGINYEEGHIEITWLYENDAELFTLICTKRHIDQYFNGIPTILHMPYIPHARMDRVKSDEDVFTLKYFCEIINSLHFNIVCVRDAHSNVSLALLNNVVDTGVSAQIAKAIELSGVDAVFFPDEGAMKRYSSNATKPFAFGMKNRDWATGQILGLNIINSDNIVGKDVLIIDDICSRGGTFYHSATALKAAGAKSVKLYVTHCENTIKDGQIFDSDLIDTIFTTHSLIHEDAVAARVAYIN